MFYLHSSNRLEHLIDALSDIVQTPARLNADAFAPETIIVQSRGMQRWLALQLAERQGVWANAEYPFPSRFLWDVLQSSLGEDPEQDSPFDWQNLEWAILRRLPEFIRKPEFASLRRYLSDPNDLLKRYQLSHQIARSFDQYVVYRPELLERWEDHRAGLGAQQLDLFTDRLEQVAWQEILWRTLVDELGYNHRAAVLKRFAAFPHTDIQSPERVCIFGLSTLAPSQLEVFGQIAKKTDIHLFQLTPCRGYYADLADRRFLSRMRRKGEAPEELGFEQGNELLASMGRLGGDFTHALLGLGQIVEEEYDVEPAEDTALHQLQYDLYNLKECRKEYSLDNSIQVHACHGCMREVEVLKNRLLDLLTADPTLQPRDILVMAPDIEKYAQPIEAVFHDPEPARDLPYSLADRHAKRSNPAGEALLQLVDLLESRFETSRLLAFLDLPIIRERFGFSESDIEQIRTWAEQHRIKWGRDAAHREEAGLPPFSEGTWQHLLDRLLAGYAMGGSEVESFGTAPGRIFTEPDVEGGLADLLGRLSACLRQLFTAARRASNRLPLDIWEGLLLDLLRHPDSLPNDVHYIADMAALFATLREHHRIAEYDETLPLDVLRHWLTRTLEDRRNEAPFLSGGVTCCNLVPMRSIPFRVICILGLNDGDYPRIQRRPGFDLVAQKRKRGDRSRREDDRYLFLEAITSARDVLYLSFHGMGIRDNAKRPPSVLLAELLDALGDDERKRVIEHPLQAYSPANFTSENLPLQSHSPHDLEAAIALRQPPLPAANRFAVPWPDSAPFEVRIQDLCKFFHSPPAWFLTRCLGLRFTEADETPDDRLPDELSELDKYHLRNAYLDHDAEGREPEFREKARGLLPPGKVGYVHSLQIVRDANAFRERLAKLQSGTPQTRDIDLQIEGIRITGRIEQIYANYALSWRFGTWRPQDEFDAWIRHLLLNATKTFDPISSKGFGRNSPAKGWNVRAEKDPRDALEHLGKMLRVFKDGHTRPLPFFPATVKKYARKRIGDKVAPEVARLAALDAWLGSPWSASDRDRFAAHRFLYQEREPFDDPQFDQLANDLSLWSWKGGGS